MLVRLGVPRPGNPGHTAPLLRRPDHRCLVHVAPARDTEIEMAVDKRRWLILGVIAAAQLMVVLDLTVMNLALPSAQRDLAFTATDRQWVVTAYALTFGSLLLFSGRLADLI